MTDLTTMTSPATSAALHVAGSGDFRDTPFEPGPTRGAASTSPEPATAPDSHIATPLSDARSQLAEAVGLLGYTDGLHQMLATPRRELSVAVPLRMDSGESRLYLGYRVQHLSLIHI